MSMPTGFADELRELREVARKLFGINFDLDVPGDSSAAAAMIQTHALHRLTDALAPLERIAGAMEATQARAEEIRQSQATTPDEREAAMEIRQEEARQSQVEPQSPPWITDHLPSESVASSGWVQVRGGGIHASFANGDCVRIKPWNAVATGEAWAPLDKTKPLFFWTSDVIPWQEFLAASSSASSEDPEPATTPDEPEATSVDLCAPQEPPQPPSTTPGGHPLDQGGWIRSRKPTEADADEDGEVLVYVPGEKLFYIDWRAVNLGQPWAPCVVKSDSLSLSPAPLPAHTAYPTSDGWIHDRVPGPKDADKDGDVEIPVNGGTGYIHWSHVVPGQPWRLFRTTAP